MNSSSEDESDLPSPLASEDEWDLVAPPPSPLAAMTMKGEPPHAMDLLFSVPFLSMDIGIDDPIPPETGSKATMEENTQIPTALDEPDQDQASMVTRTSMSEATTASGSQFSYDSMDEQDQVSTMFTTAAKKKTMKRRFKSRVAKVCNYPYCIRTLI